MFLFKNFASKKSYVENLKTLLFAFMVSCGLWYVVVGSSQIEGDILFRVEYLQLPDNLVITKGMEDEIRVRVRTSAERLRSTQNQDLVYPIDLKNIVVGANVFPVELGTSYTDLRGMEILSVSPSYLLLETDNLLQKKVPIELIFSEKENDDLYIRNLSLNPAEVTLRGPKEKLESINSLKVNFDINQVEKAGEYSKSLPLVLPEFVVADKPVTKVSFETWLDLVPVTLSRLVQVDKEGANFITEPRTVAIELEIPQSKMDSFNVDPAYMAQVRATVISSNDLAGGQVLPVEVKLPKGANLLSVTPKYVKIIEKTTDNKTDNK